MTENPFKPLATMAKAQTRIIETLGVPYADPFNEEAVISDVNDPLKLGRVKVTTDDGIVSQWIPVSGSNKGVLSARYIGSEVLVGKTNGRSENMYVIGVIRNDPDIGISGNPLQLPIIDESTAVWNETTDSGMKCNEGNEGRMYILSNEMNQDVVVCLRRTSNQVGSKPSWSWKSITSGLWVEKGINPGNETTPAVTQAQERNPGIPECNESLLGEVHEFTEDRGFRTTSMVCRRDENKNFSWLPLSAPPVFFRTTLPKCNEKVHGMEAVLDDGNNSEFLVCQRYQGLLLWVRQGRRIPHKFFSKEPPLTRIQFTTGFNPIEVLSETPISADDWAKEPEVAEVAFDTAIADIDITGTDPRLKELLRLAGLVPATAFDGAQTMRRVANEALRKKTGIPVETITQLIREDLDRDGSLTPATAQVLTGVGSAADALVNGVTGGDLDSALLSIGQSTLRNAMLSINPQAASVMTGLMSGGIMGAVDSAVAIGLDQLPPEVNKYVSPVVGIAKDLLTSAYPSSLGNILNSASGGGLLAAVSGTVNGAIGSNVVTPQLLSTLATGLSSGSLGEIPKLFGSLGNLNQISKLPAPANAIPALATTALGVSGLASAAQDLLGNGGIGLDNLDQVIGGGFSAAKTIISGVKGLTGLFGSSGSLGCPCDPKCRKTEHGEDSDGNNLIEKCGSLTANNANSYAAEGNPLENNAGPIAEDQGLSFTGVGEELLPVNIRNLSESIREISRVGEMAEKYFASKYADQVDKESELTYTFEAVEKSLKVADNNITRIESIEKKLIDALYKFLRGIGYGEELAILPLLIRDVRENSQAIRDIYNFTKRLDQVKDGPRVGVNVTTPISLAFQNIPDLARLLRVNRELARDIIDGAVKPAYEEWKTLDSGFNLDTTLGVYDDTIPDPFDQERTLFDRDRVLSISLESKLGDNSPPTENTVLDSTLSPDQLSRLKSVSARGITDGSLSPSLRESAVPPESGESSLYDDIVNRRGQTDCE